MKSGSNMPIDSNKLMWNDEELEDNIDSENEEDFLDKIVEEEKPGVDPRKYRNKGSSGKLTLT